MKRKSIFLVIVIFVSLCFIFTQNVCGNPVVAEPIVLMKNPFFAVPILIIMFFGGSGLEYAFFYLVIIKKKSFEYASKPQYRTFLKINLVTFPLTQILAYFFYVYFVQFFWLYVLLIEIGVVFIEWFLLKIELKRIIDVEITSKFILIMSFLANAQSFLVGFLVFLL